MALWYPDDNIEVGDKGDKTTFDTVNGNWTEWEYKLANPPKNIRSMPVCFPKRGLQNANKSWVVVSEHLIVSPNQTTLKLLQMFRKSKINYRFYRILETPEKSLPLITCPATIRYASLQLITSKSITISQWVQVARGTGGDKRKKTEKD